VSFAPQERDELKHVREEMIRGHEIDVVNVLSGDHVLHLREQLFHRKDLAETLSGDLKVLAVGAAKRTTGEEHGSGTMSACERGLFAEVRAHISHLQLAVLPAEPGARLLVLFETIYPALPGAKKTLFEQFAPTFFHRSCDVQRNWINAP